MAQAKRAKGSGSIQAQQQAEQSPWADDSTVDAYTEDKTQKAPEILDCRERGRHMFPSIQEIGLVFGRIDLDSQLHIRRVGCVVCRYPEGHPMEGFPRVVKVEWWEVVHKAGRVTRCNLVKSTLDYRDKDYQGSPGQGRMKPKQIRNALGTIALRGQRIIELRKSIMAGVRAGESATEVPDAS